MTDLTTCKFSDKSTWPRHGSKVIFKCFAFDDFVEGNFIEERSKGGEIIYGFFICLENNTEFIFSCDDSTIDLIKWKYKND